MGVLILDLDVVRRNEGIRCAGCEFDDDGGAPAIAGDADTGGEVVDDDAVPSDFALSSTHFCLFFERFFIRSGIIAYKSRASKSGAEFGKKIQS